MWFQFFYSRSLRNAPHMDPCQLHLHIWPTTGVYKYFHLEWIVISKVAFTLVICVASAVLRSHSIGLYLQIRAISMGSKNLMVIITA
jgi:hypothetical protein